MKTDPLTQEQADELNAIFGLDRRGKKKKTILIWESLLSNCDLSDYDFGDYQVIPLTSSWALQQEGREMRHCVGTYETVCANGTVRVFSIRDLCGQRVATVSILFKDGDWTLEQVAGLKNAEVCVSEDVIYDGEHTQTYFDMTDIHYVACEIVRLYRKAWEQNPVNEHTALSRNPPLR